MVTSSPVVPGVGTPMGATANAGLVVVGGAATGVAVVVALLLDDAVAVFRVSSLSLMGICRPREAPYDDDPAAPPTASPPLFDLEGGGTSVVAADADAASNDLEEGGGTVDVPPPKRPRCGVSWTMRRET